MRVAIILVLWSLCEFSPVCYLYENTFKCSVCVFPAEVAGSSAGLQVMPNFNIKDTVGQTVVGLSLWNGIHNMAAKLLDAGANINEKNSAGMTLLHQCIEKQDTVSALFLIEHRADIEAM